jgi:hypothetical protein
MKISIPPAIEVEKFLCVCVCDDDNPENGNSMQISEPFAQYASSSKL